MSVHFPDASFENAVRVVCANEGIIYGFGPSDFHVEIPENRDSQSVFDSIDAEHSFYALKSVAEANLSRENKAPTAQNTFSSIADTVLQNFPFTFEVARWPAIANALIVGKAAYEAKYGHSPLATTQFVYNYMEFGAERALSIYY